MPKSCIDRVYQHVLPVLHVYLYCQDDRPPIWYIQLCIIESYDHCWLCPYDWWLSHSFRFSRYTSIIVDCWTELYLSIPPVVPIVLVPSILIRSTPLHYCWLTDGMALLLAPDALQLITRSPQLNLRLESVPGMAQMWLVNREG